MANLISNLPGGARPMTTAQINEIIRGATIKAIRAETVQDPDHGGECLMLELNGGDKLIFIAVPTPPFVIDPDGLTARVQPLLIHPRHTRLHV